jgi:D-alanyl-lipoteichoic acid acyltransferase DltB (MBOAT superfamily)
MFFFQIYGDFSGYSDIAIGTARLFGFKLTKNFNIPYLARSSTEFWQRWHITLTRWFNDYVYFPIIQKNIRSTRRRNYAIIITFLLIGLWHGANWTFIVFGILQGLLIILERTSFSKDRKSTLFHKQIVPRPISIMFTFIFITASCILFRSQTIADAGYVFNRIFSFVPSDNLSRLMNKQFLVFLFIFLVSEVITRKRDFPLSNINKYLNRPLRWIIYYILIYIIIRYAGPKENFIYFQF